ncbi:hypothetical protein DESAMIL20_213 [Desulfurella amilsii]|uniref:UPF0251 protein DESAMIL20_213 n=1 Tax=Desulfurella amilsii TaxID=1562698 RepID=A0A1X4XZZ2_9BACT|nr:DUF134 domain-containing protein [Desulfurella amilsii]OSS43105.1 hypothetical protein DESAMIL20_213 [Desulfurella amilsii]
MRNCWRRRHIEFKPQNKCFKPCGIAFSQLEVNVLKHDELEALRLADYEGLYQEECARRMNISRTTFGRTIESARKKITDCLLHGKALVIEEANDFNENNSTSK